MLVTLTFSGLGEQHAAPCSTGLPAVPKISASPSV
jgi:hypothetical protein